MIHPASAKVRQDGLGRRNLKFRVSAAEILAYQREECRDCRQLRCRDESP
jgi:hypothetical protein